MSPVDEGPLERTDEQPKSDYLTKGDLKKLGIAIVVLMVILSPVYILLKQDAEKTLCSRNLKQISTAIGLYASENNDRLPPVYVTAENNSPLIEDGAAYAWVHLVDGYVREGTNFFCPSSSQEQRALVHGSKGKVEVTYGLYAPLGGEPLAQIADPDNTILIGETANSGAADTYNPVPFRDNSGNVVPFDAFLIGFNDSNELPTPSSQTVTRLAFPGTKNGQFEEGGRSRHNGGIHFISVSGRARFLGPEVARLRMERGLPTGAWAVPRTRRFR